MRRNIPAYAAVLTALAIGACAPAEVVVTAAIEQASTTEEGATETRALDNIEVQLVPFDRDVVFDSLAAEAPTPEPEIPPDLLDAREEICEAQERWQNLEARWNTLRDTLQTLTEELERYSRGEARYVALFREWEDLNARYNRVDRQVKQAFEEFRELQEASLEQSNQIRIQRDNWAEEAFADIGAIFLARLRQDGREMQFDTTSAQGVARFPDVEEGEWWVHARWEGPFNELYWNEPVTAVAGETVELRLSRENAEERPKL